MEKLDELLRPYLHPHFFFVNIGASDGVVGDPIFPFIEKYGWSGLAVEPAPPAFAQLESNYKMLQHVQCANVAVSERAQTFWYIEEGSGSAEHVMRQIGSLDRDKLLDTIFLLRQYPELIDSDPDVVEAAPLTISKDEGHGISGDIESYVRGVDIECVSFNALMQRYGVDQIDFLNIDAEGSDIEILKSIDFEKYAPTILCIETGTHPDDVRDEFTKLLQDMGYVGRLIWGHFSGVFFRE